MSQCCTPPSRMEEVTESDGQIEQLVAAIADQHSLESLVACRPKDDASRGQEGRSGGRRIVERWQLIQHFPKAEGGDDGDASNLARRDRRGEG